MIIHSAFSSIVMKYVSFIMEECINMHKIDRAAVKLVSEESGYNILFKPFLTHMHTPVEHCVKKQI